MYEHDMNYMKDGYYVVQEECEDHYINRKRRGEALKSETNEKLRLESALFMTKFG